MVQLVRHRQTKESATDRLNLNHRVTPRLHRSGSVNIRILRGLDEVEEIPYERCPSRATSSGLAYSRRYVSLPSAPPNLSPKPTARLGQRARYTVTESRRSRKTRGH